MKSIKESMPEHLGTVLWDHVRDHVDAQMKFAVVQAMDQVWENMSQPVWDQTRDLVLTSIWAETMNRVVDSKVPNHILPSTLKGLTKGL